MRKQNIFIVIITLIILTLAVGYSIFRTNVEVVGKSAVVQDLEVIFYKVDPIKQFESENAAAFISKDKKKVNISVPRLLTKGAYAIIPITIKNTGSLPARLYTISEYGLKDNKAIKVEYDGIGVTDEVLKPGDTTSFTVKISWENDLDSNYEDLKFSIDFNYVQA